MNRITYVIFLFVICSLFCFGCTTDRTHALSDSQDYSSRNGALEAKRDIQKGNLSIKAYGLQAPGTEHYIVLLKDKLNIKYEPIAGCFFDSHLESYADSYNKVIYDHVTRKFGPSAIDDIWNQSLQEYEKKKS